MKIESNKPQSFTPCSLTITFETQKELDAFGKLFNSGSIIAKLDQIAEEQIPCLWEPLQEMGADISRGGSLFRLG